MHVSRLRSPALAAALSASLLLAACGGGGGDDDPPSERGEILASTLAGHATIAQIDAGTQASGLQPLSGAAQCDVDVRYVMYVTRDPAGEPATASAGVLVPSGDGAACQGERPVVLYAHGTTTARSKNMADVQTDQEASLMMAMYAAQGFIVVAPNYLGYDRSSLTWHPYLNAQAQAVDMIDGLRAAKAHLNAESAVKPSAQLLITGYSQGGHVAMATHREIQTHYASEFTVTASGPMSGPYNLLAFGMVVNGSGPINAGATIFTPMLLTSYQRSYGNVYGSPTEAYQSPYAATAERLFPTDTPLATLIAEGRLPADPTFTLLFGTGGLLTDSYRQDFLSNENNGFRQGLARNTLLGWTPTRPVAMCGGAQDPTVFYAVNTTAMQADLNSRLPAQAAVPAFDLETRATLPAGATGDAIYGGFQARKTQAGAEVQAQYHGALVPPFCNALIRGYFQQVLQLGL
ncbi:prolyl oligopeptidase family serine peptidase [Schlegelella sp. S2-27]|uniref:Prolyl oligopeptidase family serine peptidase n=1 Tax=Caldimonas mangrovi TaxID=2944811 RepID=A0ABT0YT97_9BURK|nr:lipase family protein [Caldimonas mangrovi]MCM5681614.1 prolyl oligopeptidase family serine peptidase [Caldimonas mangrovi]